MTAVTEDLNRDIWQPFVEAYAARDVAAFAAFHATDLIRAEAADGWVGGLDAYLERVRPFFEDMTAKGADLRIGFRFHEDVVSEDLASQRGVYQIVMAVPGDPERIFYGRFHTFARRVGGRWRITVDYDTNQGVGEDDYYGS